jgi:hypothetical protein
VGNNFVDLTIFTFFGNQFLHEVHVDTHHKEEPLLSLSRDISHQRKLLRKYMK